MDSYPSRDFSGIVESVAPKATIVSGVVNYEVTINIKKDSQLLKPDMTANVSVQTAQHEALVVPSRAVQHDGAQSFVYVRTRNGPQRTRIITGTNDGESIEIKKGISLGDEILLTSVRYRASKGWWAYTLLLNFGIANATTLAYGLVRGVAGPLKLQDLAHQWWLPFTFLAGFIFGPLGEEAGWRGYLLPRLLRQYSPLVSSLILGLISALWHFPGGLIVGSASYLHSVMGLLLFTASAICMNILVTILFLHTSMSVLHAIVFHWTIMPSVTISEIIFPPIQHPPDWVRGLEEFDRAVRCEPVLPTPLK